MGSRTDQAERRIAEQRAHIEQRIEQLGERIRRDADEVRDQARDRVGNAADRIPGRDPFLDALNSHPLSTLVGAFGAGIALGVASESLPELRDHNGEGDGWGERDSRSSRRANGTGSLERMLAPLLTAAAVPLQDELRHWVRQVLDGSRSSAAREQTFREQRDSVDIDQSEELMGEDASQVDRPPDGSREPAGERTSSGLWGAPSQ